MGGVVWWCGVRVGLEDGVQVWGQGRAVRWSSAPLQWGHRVWIKRFFFLVCRVTTRVKG